MTYFSSIFKSVAEALCSSQSVAPIDYETPTLESTLAWMRDLHRHEWDGGLDVPYADHPEAAMDLFVQLYPEASEEEKMAVLLHDVKENCGVRDSDLHARHYSARTISMVDHMTRGKLIKAPYQMKVNRIIRTGDEALICAKLSDTLHNRLKLMSGRLAMSDPPRYERLVQKYTKSINSFCEALGRDPQDVIALIGPETGYAAVPGFDT